MAKKRTKHQPLSIRLYQDEALQAIARLVGYSGRPYPMSEEETKRLYERFGKERIASAADALLDYDAAAKVAKLKPEVRKLCFGLLGPAPEHEEWYYRNPDGTKSEPPMQCTDAATKSNPWESARTIAAVKTEMRKVRRKIKGNPHGSTARERAEDDLNGLREELSYAADRLAFARHSDFAPPARTRRQTESAQEYVVWKLRREVDGLEAELDAAHKRHGDEQVIAALTQRLERVREELIFQVEELVHDLVR